MSSRVSLLWRLGLLLAFAAVLTPGAASGDSRSANELRRELSGIKEKIEREKERMVELGEKVKGIELDITQAEKDLKKTEERRVKLKKAISRSGKELSVVETTVKELGAKVIHLKTLASERIKAAYMMHRRMAVIDYLISAKSVLDVQKRSRYLVLVAQYDRTRMYSLAKGFKKLADERTKLAQLKGSQETRLREVRELARSLERKRFVKGKLLDSMQLKRDQRELALNRYQEAAGKLEGILSDLMGKRAAARQLPRAAPTIIPTPRPTAAPTVAPTIEVAKVVPPPTVKPTKSVVPQETPKPKPAPTSVKPAPTVSAASVAVGTGFVGMGLRSRRGRLPLPVQGPVIRKYGAQHHADFSDVFFVKGLEFSAAKGSKVKAVAPGKVIFSEAIPEYGDVMILDHGKRYYTLYGRIVNPIPLVGDVVKAGEDIAEVGRADRWGRNFYFELRHKGKAVDPWRYFNVTPKYQPR